MRPTWISKLLGVLNSPTHNLVLKTCFISAKWDGSVSVRVSCLSTKSCNDWGGLSGCSFLILISIGKCRSTTSRINESSTRRIHFMGRASMFKVFSDQSPSPIICIKASWASSWLPIVANSGGIKAVRLGFATAFWQSPFSWIIYSKAFNTWTDQPGIFAFVSSRWIQFWKHCHDRAFGWHSWNKNFRVSQTNQFTFKFLNSFFNISFFQFDLFKRSRSNSNFFWISLFSSSVHFHLLIRYQLVD